MEAARQPFDTLDREQAGGNHLSGRVLRCLMRKLFTRFANAVAEYTGSPFAFIACVLLVLTWAITGPLFGFSDTWQLVINTFTTIVTFLMVFVIQNSQNRDTVALHLKIDELIRANDAARNSVLCIEDLTLEELDVLRERYVRLSECGRERRG